MLKIQHHLEKLQNKQEGGVMPSPRKVKKVKATSKWLELVSYGQAKEQAKGGGPRVKPGTS